MRAVTIILPTGEKIRSQSHRRYIVIRRYDDDRLREAKPFVIKRSDSLFIARGAKRGYYPGAYTYIFDTLTGEFI